MYARVTRFEVADGKEKELVKGYDATLEHVKAQKGFQEAVLLIDAEGKAVSVTFWDNKENLEASGKTAPGSVIEKILPMVRPYQKAPPTFSHFEVKLRVKVGPAIAPITRPSPRARCGASGSPVARIRPGGT